MGDSGRARAWRRRAGAPGRMQVSRWRLAAGLVSVAMAGAGLAACGTSSAATGPVTLNFYFYPDTSTATDTGVKDCNAQSHGKYTISYQVLPVASDNQRLELVRRLAAHDDTMDILGLDVTWEAEFAQAGWIAPWTGQYKAEAENGTLGPALQTAIWKGQLVAVPDNSNTQLLWYNSALTPKPPTTWAQMIADAEQLAKEGKPHYIEIQGAQYEGITVWFNTMVASAGGTILNPDATKVTLGAPAVKALSIMKELASSPGRGPVAVGADGERQPARLRGGHRGLRAELPVRVSVHEGRQPQAVQDVQVGALPAGHPRRRRPR